MDALMGGKSWVNFFLDWRWLYGPLLLPVDSNLCLYFLRYGFHFGCLLFVIVHRLNFADILQEVLIVFLFLFSLDQETIEFAPVLGLHHSFPFIEKIGYVIFPAHFHLIVTLLLGPVLGSLFHLGDQFLMLTLDHGVEFDVL